MPPFTQSKCRCYLIAAAQDVWLNAFGIEGLELLGERERCRTQMAGYVVGQSPVTHAGPRREERFDSAILARLAELFSDSKFSPD
jgi:hypothetical protein